MGSGAPPSSRSHRPRRTAALAALLALAVLTGGCGGSETESAPTTENGGEAGRSEEAGAGGQGGKQKPQRRGEEGQRGEEQRPRSAGGSNATGPKGAAPTRRGSLPNEGTEEPAPGVPIAKGGDNSIQEYGVEAPSADRVRAARNLHAYLDARAAAGWTRACSELSASAKRRLAQFGSQAQGKGSEAPGCAEILRSLTAGSAQSALQTAAEIRVLSLRVEGAQAFLLYRNGEGTPSAIQMHREGGQWKVGAIDGSALFLGPWATEWTGYGARGSSWKRLSFVGY